MIKSFNEITFKNMNQCKNAILMRISLSRVIDHVGDPNLLISQNLMKSRIPLLCFYNSNNVYVPKAIDRVGKG